MAEYITKEQAIAWFSPYGHTDEPIPFEVLAADLRGCIPAADVAPVRHGRWIPEICESVSKRNRLIRYRVYSCSVCGRNNGRAPPIYCPNCGAKMDLEGEP